KLLPLLLIPTPPDGTARRMARKSGGFPLGGLFPRVHPLVTQINSKRSNGQARGRASRRFMRTTGKTMRGLIATMSSLALVALASPALAQQATKLGQHNAWGTYSYQASGGKVCYVLTVPTDKQPSTL